MSSQPESSMRVSEHHKTIALHFVVGVLIFVAMAWGGVMLAAGDAAATSPTYDLVRQVPYGMRAWGALLLVGAVALSWGLGRDDRGHPRALNITLAGGVFYYCTFSLLILITWLRIGQVPSVGAFIFNVAFAALYWGCARQAAPPKAPTKTTKHTVDSAGAAGSTGG